MSSPWLSLWSCVCVRVYLLYSALLLDLALSQLLQQDQLGLLESQLFLELLDDALPLLGAALLDTKRTKHTSEADPMLLDWVGLHRCCSTHSNPNKSLRQIQAWLWKAFKLQRFNLNIYR